MQDKTDKRVKLLILSEKGEKELDLSMKRIDEELFSFLNRKDYNKIQSKIALKYEAALIKELNSIKPESISRWIDETKKKGMVLSDKVFSKAIAIRNGQRRSPRDNNNIK